jgi:hypothetical protein
MILSRNGVTVDGVWVGNRIYCAFTGRNYKYQWQCHWVTHPKDHCNYSIHKVYWVFISRCLVAAFNGGRSPSSWVPELSTASATSFSLSQLRLSTGPTDWTTRSQSEGLAVCLQSVRLGAKPPEVYDQRFGGGGSWTHAVVVLMLTSSLARRWICLLWICIAFVKCMPSLSLASPWPKLWTCSFSWFCMTSACCLHGSVI